MHILAKTGKGRSKLVETLFSQDLKAGRGCVFIDPHGDLGERIVAQVPYRRKADLIYADLTDPTLAFGYNPLSRVVPQRRSLVASGIMELFEKMWPQAWGQRMEHILRNTLLALLDGPDTTFADIPRLYSDKAFRNSIISTIANEQVRAFWLREYPKYTFRYEAEAVAPIQNKVGAFLADPRLRKFLVAPEQPLRLRQIMDEGKILVVNLAKGRIGTDSSSLLGGLLVTAISLAAFSRAELPLESRRPFHAYIDEFQTFTTLSIANMTAELRKYAIGLVLAHQYLHQLSPDVRHAVLGNAGTLISFRVGAEDAEFLAREFQPVFDVGDLIRLPNYHMYLRLMIDGEPCNPFSARSLVGEARSAS